MEIGHFRSFLSRDGHTLVDGIIMYEVWYRRALRSHHLSRYKLSGQTTMLKSKSFSGRISTAQAGWARLSARCPRIQAPLPYQRRLATFMWKEWTSAFSVYCSDGLKSAGRQFSTCAREPRTFERHAVRRHAIWLGRSWNPSTRGVCAASNTTGYALFGPVWPEPWIFLAQLL